MTNMRCSLFGIFCIFFAWLASILLWVISVYQFLHNMGIDKMSVMAFLSLIMSLGIIYALWMALKYATSPKD